MKLRRETSVVAHRAREPGSLPVSARDAAPAAAHPFVADRRALIELRDAVIGAAVFVAFVGALARCRGGSHDGPAQRHRPPPHITRISL